MQASIEDLVDACRRGLKRFVEDWIAAGKSVNKPGSGKTTALMAVSERGHAEIAKLLVAAGADARCEGGHKDVVDLLINPGADLACKSILGDTDLSLALSNGKMRVAKMLESEGAVVNAKRPGRLPSNPPRPSWPCAKSALPVPQDCPEL